MNPIALVGLLPALPLIAAGCASAAGPAAAPAPAAPNDANSALVRRYIEEVLNGGKLEVLAELLAPDYKRYLAAGRPPLNAEQQQQRLAGLRAAFPDLQITIDDLLAAGDRVAFRGTARGTHQGPLLGLAPTGKPWTVTALEIVRIENGRFVEHWGGPDMLSLLLQLGAVVAPPK